MRGERSVVVSVFPSSAAADGGERIGRRRADRSDFLVGRSEGSSATPTVLGETRIEPLARPAAPRVASRRPQAAPRGERERRRRGGQNERKREREGFSLSAPPASRSARRAPPPAKHRVRRSCPSPSTGSPPRDPQAHTRTRARERTSKTALSLSAKNTKFETTDSSFASSFAFGPPPCEASRTSQNLAPAGRGDSGTRYTHRCRAQGKRGGLGGRVRKKKERKEGEKRGSEPSSPLSS
jgi:hypothetical protein